MFNLNSICKKLSITKEQSTGCPSILRGIPIESYLRIEFVDATEFHSSVSSIVECADRVWHTQRTPSGG